MTKAMNIKYFVLKITFFAQFIGYQTMAHESIDTTDKLQNYKGSRLLLGRFSLDLPGHLAIKQSSFVFKDVTVEEERYTAIASDDIRKKEKLTKFYKAANRYGPRLDGTSWIATETEIANLGTWAQFIAKHQGSLGTESVIFNLLVDYRDVFVHYSSPGALKKSDNALSWFSEIAQHYHTYNSHPLRKRKDAFHLKHGYIQLPYNHQEETFAMFENLQLGITLTFNISTVYKVESSTLGERFDAALLAWVIPGLSVDKIHSGARVVDGLKGNELIMRTSEKDRTDVRFLWNYPGRPDSGEHPNIDIEMLTKDGDLEKKRQIWEQILAGFRRISKHRD